MGERVAKEKPRSQGTGHSSYHPPGRTLAPVGGMMRDPGNEVNIVSWKSNNSIYFTLFSTFC